MCLQEAKAAVLRLKVTVSLYNSEFFFFCFLLIRGEVLSDDSQTPCPPTLFSQAFTIADWVL